jgi:hypothetical protein
MIVYYIKNQRKHHGAEPFIEEFRRLLVDNEIVIDEQYFMEE